MTVDGPLSLLVRLGFILCMLALLVFLIQQYRRTNKRD
jgi:hypothetical protein